uniref:Uncharacterized protein n=1 Tax=Brassica campestris TaxID=3711 RepID=M4FJ10_BRACM
MSSSLFSVAFVVNDISKALFDNSLSYADFLSGSIPSASSPVLGSPFTQRTSVPQQQPAAPSQIIEDRLLNELLLAPGRELLPKLSRNGEPNTSWFRKKNRNAICKSILKCFHSLLDLPYPTYAHVPLEKQKMWLRSFATAENDGVPPDWLALMRDMHTNKQTGEVQDPVARELLETLTKLKEDKEAQLQQSQLFGNDGASTASNMLSGEEINQIVLENVPVKKGRRYGVGRVSEGISSSSQATFSSPSLVHEMEQLKTELIEERTKRQALEDQLRSVTDFISRVYPEEFSASQSQPDQ